MSLSSIGTPCGTNAADTSLSTQMQAGLNPDLGNVHQADAWALAGRIMLADVLHDVSERLPNLVRECSSRPAANPRLNKNRQGG